MAQILPSVERQGTATLGHAPRGNVTAASIWWGLMDPRSPLDFTALALLVFGVSLQAGCERSRSGTVALDATLPEGAYRVGAGPYAVIAADANSDGLLDYATANVEDESITVLYAASAGRPGRRIDLPTGGITPALAEGDFNGDGVLEIVAAIRSPHGHLSFFSAGVVDGIRPVGRVRLDGTPNDVVMADLDADGRADAVTALKEGEVAVVWGTLGSPSVDRYPVLDCGTGGAYGPDGVDVADVDGDGFLDVAVACYATWSIHLLHGTGERSPGKSRKVFGVSRDQVIEVMRYVAPDRLEAGRMGGLRKAYARDLDDDGYLDLIAVGDYGILLVVPGGSDGLGPGHLVSTGVDGTNNLDVGDIDSDGRSEILITTGHEPALIVVEELDPATGSFELRRVADLAETPESIRLVEIDDDGHLDLVVAAEHGSAVSILRGDGEGGFAPFEL